MPVWKDARPDWGVWNAAEKAPERSIGVAKSADCEDMHGLRGAGVPSCCPACAADVLLLESSCVLGCGSGLLSGRGFAGAASVVGAGSAAVAAAFVVGAGAESAAMAAAFVVGVGAESAAVVAVPFP